MQSLIPIESAITASVCDDDLGPRWFAAYTCAHHEKRVASQLAERAIPYYLPLYESMRRWKDRRKLLELPLFPGYLFVRMHPRDHLKIVGVPGMVRLVGFGGQPTAVPEGEIAAIRACLEQKCRIEPHPFLRAGQRVRIVRGALEGTEGLLLRKKGMFRLVLSVGLIMRSVAVEVDATDVEPIQSFVRSESRPGHPEAIWA